MEDKIKKILDFHRQQNPGVTVVTVTITQYYEIPAGTWEPIPDLINEWFVKYPLPRTHAFRDGSLLLQHFNGDAKIINPE